MTIPPDKRAGLRISLVRSHAAGLGAPIEPEVGVGGRDLPEGPHAGSGSQWGSRTSGSVTRADAAGRGALYHDGSEVAVDLRAHLKPAESTTGQLE